jgi:hypothetical protein
MMVVLGTAKAASNGDGGGHINILVSLFVGGTRRVSFLPVGKGRLSLAPSSLSLAIRV